MLDLPLRRRTHLGEVRKCTLFTSDAVREVFIGLTLVCMGHLELYFLGRDVCFIRCGLVLGYLRVKE